MLRKIVDFLESQKINFENKKVLIAVSGGIDSMVLVHAAKKLEWNFAIAHMNFKLRGDESEGDQIFVEKQAAHYRVKVFCKQVDTLEFATQHKISVQEAARNLRYEWFDELATEEEFQYILTAHHAGDVAETLLFNLVRGAGLSGAHGILASNGKIIRPMLQLSRQAIEEFASQENISWREDSSNSSEKYSRNKIRHSILPLLESINPEAQQHLMQHAFLMKGYEEIISGYMMELEHRLVIPMFDGKVSMIYLSNLKSYPSPEILLYHFFGKYGFNSSDFTSLLYQSETGAQFISGRHRLVLGSDTLVFLKNFPEEISEPVLVVAETKQIDLTYGNITMEISNPDLTGRFPVKSDKHTAILDAAKLRFPLTVRVWRRGDSFRPFGMRGTKLISDFLTDEKIPSGLKEIVYLLVSDNEVAWVVGHRISDDFKITPETGTVAKFQYHQQ